ncbi:hypothetical protein [Pseudogracilibacillus sp. SO30301A]|uniref:hypothetical protein n=1 Tax=Pseudogracilibacillus sp. SO30301A TaxID=3098291 RepID=UPI00300E2AF1
MIGEIIENIKRRKLYSILVIFFVSCFLVTMFLIGQIFQVFLERESMIESFEGLEVYPIMDTLDNDEEFQTFLNEPGALEKVKAFYNQLNENIEDDYLYVFQQPVEVESIIDEVYLEGYEEGRGEERKSYGSPYPVKTVQMNGLALNMFPLEIADGESFISEDFQYKENGEIPVLLGSEYSQYFDVGDSIKGSYIFKEFNFIVKGFLKPYSFVERPQFPEINLERSIVMPAMEFEDPKSLDDEEFQLRHYMQLINGAIYSENDRSNVDQQLQYAREVSGFSHSTLLGESTTTLGAYFDALAQHKNWLIFFAVVLFLVCVGGTSMVMVKKTKENSKNIMIHLISGGTIQQISRIIYGEVTVLVLIPTSIITFIILVFMPQLPLMYPLIIFITGVIVITVTVLQIHILIRRTPTSQWLKRGEE